MEPSHLPCSSLTHPAAILTPSIGVLRWIRAKIQLQGQLLSESRSAHHRVPVDTTVFEMWLGSLSTHRGLSIPVV